MNNAYIYFDGFESGYEGFGQMYSGEGPYVLVFNGKVIDSHFCSSRSWAEHDLIRMCDREEMLLKLNVDQVISNGTVIWRKVDLDENSN